MSLISTKVATDGETHGTRSPGPDRPRDPPSRGARAALHGQVRGLKDVPAVLEVVRRDLEAAARGEPVLLVVLVDPWPRTARAVANLSPALEGTLAASPASAKPVLRQAPGPAFSD